MSSKDGHLWFYAHWDSVRELERLIFCSPEISASLDTGYFSGVEKCSIVIESGEKGNVYFSADGEIWFCSEKDETQKIRLLRLSSEDEKVLSQVKAEEMESTKEEEKKEQAKIEKKRERLQTQLFSPHPNDSTNSDGQPASPRSYDIEALLSELRPFVDVPVDEAIVRALQHSQYLGVKSLLDDLLDKKLDKEDTWDEVLQRASEKTCWTPAKDSAFFDDIPATLKADKLYFEGENIEQFTLWEGTITFSNPKNIPVEWKIDRSATASRHHFFTCVAFLGDNVYSNSSTMPSIPSSSSQLGQRGTSRHNRRMSAPKKRQRPDPNTIFQEVPHLHQWLVKPTHDFAYCGTLQPHEELVLRLSFVFLQPRPSGDFHFRRIIPIQFTASDHSSTAFAAVVLKGRSAGNTKQFWKPELSDIRIDKSLGAGSYGFVRSCTIRGLPCAIKLWNKASLKHESCEFEKESNLLSSLSHDHLIPFIGCNKIDNDIAFVLMKLAPASLDETLRTDKAIRKWSLKQRLGLSLQAARGIQYLHEKSYIHGDIKSLNMVYEAPDVFLIDFGGAVLADSRGYATSIPRGTSLWNAPEVQIRQPCDSKCDVYAFGIVMWEIACLRRPPLPDGLDSVPSFYIVPSPPLDNDILDQSPDFAALYRLCTAKEAANRPDIGHVIRELSRIVNSP